MQLDELKKSMSTLEQVLTKTNSDIRINVSVSETAQSKILRKFRRSFTSCLILAVVFAAMIAGGIDQPSLSVNLEIYLAVYLALGAIWNMFLYRKLSNINIATLPPAELFTKTARLRMSVLSGEIFFGIGLAVLFTLLLPDAWAVNRIGFWCMVATLAFGIILGVIHYWPQYIKLFRDLDSIKE